MKILRNKYVMELGEKKVKGKPQRQVDFLDQNYKKLNEWIKPGHYDSSKVIQTREATVKRIGRAEAGKATEEQLRKSLPKLMKNDYITK